MQNLVDLLAEDYGWSDSVSNLSAKLQRESIRYKGAIELADIPGVEAMRTKLKKFDMTYKELTEEKAALEKKLSTASKESVRKKLEISQKLNELDELRRTVEVLPPKVLKAAKKGNSA